MAIVKTVKPKITAEARVSESIEYITKKEKSYKVSYNLCIRNTPTGLAEEFKTTRIAYNKNDNILVHHLIQSFSPDDNITPEEAHQIGLELIEKELSNYKVIISTHIDKDYLHNHFIINSVSPFDGKKFLDNKSTLNSIRKTSDNLCCKHNLTVLDKDRITKYKTLNRATLHTAKRGKSWKFNLVNDLDLALSTCKTKEEFISFFKNHNYEIKFTNANIAFLKIGQKKSIRADTLAKEFGQKYSKANIEKNLNISSDTTENKNQYIPPAQPQNLDYYNQIAARDWKRYEKRYKNKIRFNDNRYFDRILFSRNPLIFTLRLIRYIFSKSNKTAKSKIKYNSIGQERYKVKTFTDYKNLKKIIGNIPYKTIINTPGEAVQLKLYSWQIAKLLHNNVLLSSKIDIQTGTAICTLKKTDIEKVARVLNVSSDSLYSQAKEIKNRKNNFDIRKHNGEVSYLVISQKQIDTLDYYGIKYASYPKGDKFNIVFSKADKDKILSILYPNRNEENMNEDTFFKRNSVINRKLREESSKTGEKLCYKIIFSNQYKALRETTIEFAVFRQKDGKYNVVFLEHNKADIEKAIGGKSNVKTTNASNAPNTNSKNLKI